MGRRICLLVVAASLLAACASAPPPAPPRDALPTASLGEQDLLAALQDGGLVVYLRHAATDTTVDAVGGAGAGCGAERNLTVLGREQAERIGEGFRDRAIPTGEVRASPTCRTMDTAVLAFGDRVEEDALLLPADDPDAAPGRADALRRLLTTPVPAGNRVLVGHQSNIADAAAITLAEGEAAVFSPAEDGEPLLIGTIPVDAWES